MDARSPSRRRRVSPRHDVGRLVCGARTRAPAAVPSTSVARRDRSSGAEAAARRVQPSGMSAAGRHVGKPLPVFPRRESVRRVPTGSAVAEAYQQACRLGPLLDATRSARCGTRTRNTAHYQNLPFILRRLIFHCFHS